MTTPTTIAREPAGTVRWQGTPAGADELTSTVASLANRLFVGDLSGWLYALDAASGAELWRLDTGSPYPLTPTVGRLLYVTTGPSILAIDPVAGVEHWRFEAGREQFLSRPALIGGLAVTASEFDMVALDDLTGEVLWQVDAPEGSGWWGDPLGAIDLGLVVMAADRSLVALDLATGNEVWRFVAGEIEGFYSEPARARTQVLAAAGNALYALDLTTGARIWSMVGGPDLQLNEAPAVAGDAAYVTNGEVIAVDVATGAERWRSGAIDPASSPVASSTPIVDGDQIYLTLFDGIAALSIEDGRLRWQHAATLDLGTGRPSIADGVLYVTEVGLGTGELVAVDAATGQTMWRQPMLGEGYFRPPIVLEDLVVAMSYRGVIAVER